MDANEEKFLRMTTQPVGGLVCRLAVPCIVSMMITALYNPGGHLLRGKDAQQQRHRRHRRGLLPHGHHPAVGFFFGHGSGNFISRELGGHRPGQAEEMAATGFLLSFAGGCLLTLLGLLFLEPLVRLLGSTDTILPYAKSYVRIILLGAPWMTASLTLNNQLRFQGSAVYGMVGITAGAVLNIGLDPLLIFTCGMGVSGAAVATIVSQFAGFCLLLLGCRPGAATCPSTSPASAPPGATSPSSSRAASPPWAARP